ncbi:hypothetical protein RclHR1_35600001 [Rhizophagus clarus]|nr:hypothetical protein RclHR1_35600001 [Rhizophagus clarus]
MSIKYKEYSNLVFLDNKHHCKVGEPNCSVAAVDQGKSVIVANGMTFAVVDHDFTKCGLILSVIMQAEIPNSINESFYRSNVFVGLKDPIFEPSSAMSLFLALDLDYLVAVRTPPGHFWNNLVERIMSILNLRLQCIGLMHQKMDKELEEIMSKCNSMNDIRKAAEKAPRLKNELKESLNLTITLLNNLFKRLQLKDKNFETFEAASEFNMNALSPQHVLDTLYHLPDPIPANDEHYKNFDDIYEASENDNILSDMESEEEIEVSDEKFISTEDNANINTKRNDMGQELKNVLSKVFVNAALECYGEMEKTYYSANFLLPICFNCDSSEYVTPMPEKQYPYCEACTTDPNILIKIG